MWYYINTNKEANYGKVAHFSNDEEHNLAFMMIGKFEILIDFCVVLQVERKLHIHTLISCFVEQL